MMRESGTTALVRAAGFGDLPALVEAHAGERRLHALFESEHLPIAVRDAPATPIPLRSMVGLFSRGGDLVDSRTFGLEVGERMTFRGYGLWVEHAIAAPTLGEAIVRASTTSWAH